MTSQELGQEANEYFKAVSDTIFTEAADRLLKKMDNPELLAKCAELAVERNYGGAMYQALFWSEAERNCSSKTKQFAELCKITGTTVASARRHVEVGNLIAQMGKEGLAVELLARAPNHVIVNAARQNGKVEAYLRHSIDVLERYPEASHYKIHNKWCKIHGSVKANLDVIKPSDWWAFGRPKWERDEDFPGSIPGEIYANALYYFAPSAGVAVDPMSGSGMLKRVYEDRARWQRDRKFDLDLHYFDLHPKRPYIKKHDARQQLPVSADWIFLDPPYYGQSDHLYEGTLASSTNYDDYLLEITSIVEAMSYSLNSGGILCILLPKWSGHSIDDPNYNTPGDVLRLATQRDLLWVDFAVVSRGRQQESNGARLNERAKAIRRMRSDTCVLNVFRKGV